MTTRESLLKVLGQRDELVVLAYEIGLDLEEEWKKSGYSNDPMGSAGYWMCRHGDKLLNLLDVLDALSWEKTARGRFYLSIAEKKKLDAAREALA